MRRFLLLLLLGCAVPRYECAADDAFPRLPYLQVVSSTAMTVRWRTADQVQGRVWYGTAPDGLSLFADAATAGTEQEVRITGLQPNTRYYYGVGDSAGFRLGGD